MIQILVGTIYLSKRKHNKREILTKYQKLKQKKNNQCKEAVKSKFKFKISKCLLEWYHPHHLVKGTELDYGPSQSPRIRWVKMGNGSKLHKVICFYFNLYEVSILDGTKLFVFISVSTECQY